ncbi:MAG TPA: hypothetical protein VHB79_15420 [Polyangiaceae bacterium]|nr:hypothetical protein [Polyangiaceae bacterium]
MLTCSTAFAAPTDQERAAARNLATEGINAFESGRNAEALDKLERAFQLASIPTIGLWSARALEKAGKLVEANERLMVVGRYDVARTDPEVFNQAKADAEQMQAALAPRIPQLKVELVHPAEGTDITVELDHVALKSALVGVPFQVNPGKHSISARAGADHVDRDVAIAERDSARVVLDVASLHSAAPATTAASNEPPASPGAAAAAAPASDEAPRHPAAKSSTGRHIAGWIVLGLGAGGLVTAGVLGAKAIEQHSLYEDRCPQGKCSSAYQQYYDTYQTNQLLAIVSGGVGVVAFGAGLYLVLSGDSSSSNEAFVQPYVGFGTAGAVGRF